MAKKIKRALASQSASAVPLRFSFPPPRLPVTEDLVPKPSVIQSTASISPSFCLAMAPKGFDMFLSSLNNHFNTDTFSDVVVACESQEFKVHRLILSSHSKYFTKQLNGNWKESSEKRIEIQDFDPGVVESMLRFMYSMHYNNINGISSMVHDAQVYQIADKYDIPALKEHSKDRFESSITAGWSMDDFPIAINVVYESTPSEDRGLRDLAVETSLKNLDELLGHDGFGKTLRRNADFAADLIPFLSAKARPNDCPSCHSNLRKMLF